jgi:alpha-1,6-mannosyltransferase
MSVVRSPATLPMRHAKNTVTLPSALAILLVASVTSLALVLPHAPETFQNRWGFVNGADRLASVAAFGAAANPWPEAVFVGAFRCFLLTAWVAWALLVVSIACSSPLRSHPRLWGSLWVVAALTAVLFPLVLSRDVLGYVAYGRLAGLYGVNPYLNGREVLVAAGDETAAFLVWDTPLPYGPLWVIVAAAVAKICGGGSLLLEALLHKALSAAALVGGAIAGARLAAHLGRGSVAAVTVAIALNPLLLIEGPGTGHNDLMMTSLLVWGGLFSTRRKRDCAALAVGLAAAMKPIAFAAVPLLLADHWRCEPGARRVVPVLRMLGLAILPTALLSVLFGGPSVLLMALMERLAGGAGHFSATRWAIAATATPVALWLLNRRSPHVVPGRWVIAWVPLALAFALAVMPLPFPWYITWAILPALSCLNEDGIGLVAVSAMIGLLLMWQYTIPI